MGLSPQAIALDEVGAALEESDRAISERAVAAAPSSAETPATPPRFRTKWDIVAGIAFIHAGALLAPFTFTWSAFWVFIVLQFATGLLGVTLCYRSEEHTSELQSQR